MGLFPATEWVRQDLLSRYGVHRLAPCEGVTERFFAIGTERKVRHPLVQRLLRPPLHDSLAPVTVPL